MPWYGIGFIDAFKRAFKKTFTFSGRASRGEFWWFQPAIILISFISAIPLSIIFLLVISFRSVTVMPMFISLMLQLPNLAVACRRLHDIGKSGWILLGTVIASAASLPLFIISSLFASKEPDNPFNNNEGLYIILAILFAIIFLAATIYNVILLAQPSQATANQYGPGPQEVAQYIANPTAQQYTQTPIQQTPPAPPSPPDPVLTELADPATPATRLQEIAALAAEHPEYRAALLAHPNIYPDLAT